jgi:ABC-2 type transport system permease protein
MNTLRVMRYALLVGREEFRVFWTWYTWLGGWLPRIIAQVAFFAMLGYLLDDPDRLRFLIIGNAVFIGCQTIFVAIATSTWDRWDGTYPMLVISPTSLLPAITGRTLVWPINGIVTSVLALYAFGIALGLDFPWPEALLAVPLVAIALLSVYAFSLFLGAVVTRIPHFRNVFLNLAAIGLLAFAGVNVPLEFWPVPVEALAHALPLTHGLIAVRELLDGGSGLVVLQHAGLEVVVGAGWLLASLLLIDRMADAGRRNGSIDFL